MVPEVGIEPITTEPDQTITERITKARRNLLAAFETVLERFKPRLLRERNALLREYDEAAQALLAATEKLSAFEEQAGKMGIGPVLVPPTLRTSNRDFSICYGEWRRRAFPPVVKRHSAFDKG